jgi:hypothetical protein
MLGASRQDYALHEHSFIEGAEARLDDFLAQGREVLNNLVTLWTSAPCSKVCSIGCVMLPIRLVSVATLLVGLIGEGTALA